MMEGCVYYQEWYIVVEQMLNCCWFTVAQWFHMTLWSFVYIVLGYDVSLVQRQAVTWTNADFADNWTFRNTFQWNFDGSSTIFFQESTFAIMTLTVHEELILTFLKEWFQLPAIFLCWEMKTIHISRNEFSDTWLKHIHLTHCGLVLPFGDSDLVNIDSGNGLVPSGTKPWPEPVLTYHQ